MNTDRIKTSRRDIRSLFIEHHISPGEWINLKHLPPKFWNVDSRMALDQLIDDGYVSLELGQFLRLIKCIPEEPEIG